MSRPQAVIFDIGNVLIGWQPEAIYDAAIGRPRREAFFRAVPIHAANLEIDRGAPFRATLEALAADHPDWRAEIMMWHDDWHRMVHPVIPHSVALMRALRARGIPVFALTNFGVETFTLAGSMFDFLNEFDREYVSGRLRLIKPDDAIYAVVEADSGLSGGALIFVDDRPENIAAAQARGWKGHVFDGPEGWARRLVAEGLLTEGEAGL